MYALLVFLGGVWACGLEHPDAAEGPYGYLEAPTEDGTGKVYLGREIASLMGHEHGMVWLERPGREAAELPDRLISALGLSPYSVVADIGAGTGYFTFRISPHVPGGRVFAVEVQPEMVAGLTARRDALGARNVEPILGTPTDPNLPPERVDVALLVVSYHEFSHPHEMMSNIVMALKPGGRVVLVEYRGEDDTLPIPRAHRMTEAQARREMEAVGLHWHETREILPQQHLMVFRKPISP